MSLAFEKEEELGGLPIIPHFTMSDLRKKQRNDTSIREVINQIQLGEKPPPTAKSELPELGLLLREWNKLVLKDGVLYRTGQEGAQTQHQLVLPKELRPLVLKSLHDDMGHMGVERTLDLIRKRFYWPKLASDVELKVKACDRCHRRKV